MIAPLDSAGATARDESEPLSFESISLISCSLTFTDISRSSWQRNSLTDADNRTTCDHAAHVAWRECRDKGGCDDNHTADHDSGARLQRCPFRTLWTLTYATLRPHRSEMGAEKNTPRSPCERIHLALRSLKKTYQRRCHPRYMLCSRNR